jgi:hypothetical protein
MKKIDLFDEILRKKLEQTAPPMVDEHWALLEQQLDDGVLDEEPGHAAADSKPIDEVIFEKLHSYEAAPNPTHWEAMDVRLNEVFTWPVQVIRYKVAELSIMFLLFLFIWQVTPTQPAVIPHGTPPIASLQEGEKDRASVVEGMNTGGDIVASSKYEPELETPSQINTIPSKENIASSQSSSLLEHIIPDENQMEESNPSLLLTSRRESVAQEMSYLEGISPPLTLPTRPLPSLPLSNTVEIIEGARSFMSPLDVISTLSFSELSSSNDVLAQVATQGLKTKKKGVIRVGMFGSGEYNHMVITPGLEKAREEEENRFAIGYGGGFSVGIDMGRWELETGAGYAARRYPVGFIYVEGSLEDGLFASELRAGELNIINIPMHFRYNFIYKNNWRAYALTGGALQLAVQAGYNAVEAPEHTYIPPGIAMQVPGPSPAPGGDNSLTRIKKESVGLLEGGAFNDNAYITGNLGIGVERYINDAWSLYVQPTYQHSLHYFREGLGPNKDEINSLSFLIGTKVRLK